jgi:hypothetical protein
VPALQFFGRPVATLLLFTLLVLQPVSSAALTVEGISFDESVRIGNKQIPIRGATLLRWLKIFKVYVAALYLPENGAPDNALADIPKRLEISYLVSIAGPDFGKGAEAILERNNSPDVLANLRNRIDQLNATYRDAKPVDR